MRMDQFFFQRELYSGPSMNRHAVSRIVIAVKRKKIVGKSDTVNSD